MKGQWNIFPVKCTHPRLDFNPAALAALGNCAVISCLVDLPISLLYLPHKPQIGRLHVEGKEPETFV